MYMRVLSMAVAALLFTAEAGAFGFGSKQNSENLVYSGTGTVIPEKVVVGRFTKKPQEDLIGDAKAIANDKNLAIPFFRVKFLKFSGDTESRSSFLGNASDTVRVTIHGRLEGIDDSVFQLLTNEAYSDLRKQLEDAGYSLVPTDQVISSEHYSDYNKDFPKSTTNYVTAVPEGMGYFGITGLGNDGGRLIQGLQAGILTADYLFNFASIGKSSDESFDRVSASVSIGPVAHVFGTMAVSNYEGAKCNSFNGCWGTNGNMRLGQATYSTQAFGKFRDDMSGGMKAAQTGLKVASMLLGGSSNSVEQVALDADVEQFKSAARDALNQANKRFVDAIVAGAKG